MNILRDLWCRLFGHIPKDGSISYDPGLDMTDSETCAICRMCGYQITFVQAEYLWIRTIDV